MTPPEDGQVSVTELPGHLQAVELCQIKQKPTNPNTQRDGRAAGWKPQPPSGYSAFVRLGPAGMAFQNGAVLPKLISVSPP